MSWNDDLSTNNDLKTKVSKLVFELRCIEWWDESATASLTSAFRQEMLQAGWSEAIVNCAVAAAFMNLTNNQS